MLCKEKIFKDGKNVDCISKQNNNLTMSMGYKKLNKKQKNKIKKIKKIAMRFYYAKIKLNGMSAEQNQGFKLEHR